MGRGMRRKSRVKSRIVLVIAYVGSIALLAGHYQDLSQRERVLRTHLIEDVATRLADFMALHARLLKSLAKPVINGPDGVYLADAQLSEGPWHHVEVVLADNQKWTFIPGEPPHLSQAAPGVMGAALTTPALLATRSEARPDHLLLQVPLVHGYEVEGLVNAELPLSLLESRLAESHEQPGQLFIVNDRNQTLAQRPQPLLVASLPTLADLLPESAAARILYPQDLIEGHYQTFGDQDVLRIALKTGGAHLFHRMNHTSIRERIYPEMAIPVSGTLFLLGLLHAFLRLRRQTDELGDTLNEMDFLFRNSQVPQLLVDTRTDRLIKSNRSASKLFGFPRKTLVEIPFSNLCRPTKNGDQLSIYGGVLRQARLSGNKKILVEVIAAIPAEQHSRLQHYFIWNTSALDKHSQNIRFQAYYDPLTQLPNRNFLFEHLQKLLASHRREQHQFALLFVDLDRFKQVNDTLGHDIGDQVLLAVGERLKARLRESDILARLGGDEFTVVLPHLRDQLDAISVAKTLVKTLSDPFIVNGYDIHIGASVGISLFPDNGEDAHTLLKNADIAMYQAKERGRSGFCFFEEDMNASLLRKVGLEKDILAALDSQQFFLEYQPIIDVASRQIAGAEVLLRWNHPIYGTLSPADFIRIAEETGQMAAISEWVLREALAYMEGWLDQQDAELPLFIAINMSQRQLINLQHVKRWQDIISASRIPSRRIMLELDEKVYAENTPEVTQALNQLMMMGVQLSLDDFGRGDASLRLLQALPISTLKIDFSGITSPTVAARPPKFVQALVKLGQALDLKVTAVGIEEATQLALLEDAGCNYAQGYWFSEPLSATKFKEFVHSYTPDIR